MATPQLSPGTLIREVDLTVGRVDNVVDNTGAIAAPFAIGPVEEPILINNEKELIEVFGKSSSKDNHYEYWMSASSYLSYGGNLRVIRVGDDNLENASVGYSSISSVVINNFDHYNNNLVASDYHFAARTPGTWANGLKVCLIDDKADQIVSLNNISLGANDVEVGYGVTVSLNGRTNIGVGTTSVFIGYLQGVVTGVSTERKTVDIKFTAAYDTANGVEVAQEYKKGSNLISILDTDDLYFTGVSTSGIITASDVSAVSDWYEQQYISLNSGRVYWSSIAPKPVTTQYARERGAKNDAIHIVVVDDNGTITGIRGNLLEKHTALSKSVDAISASNSPLKIYFKDYIANFSSYVYSGSNNYTEDDTENNIKVVSTEVGSSGYATTTPNGAWGVSALNHTFNCIGNHTLELNNGHDYNAENNFKASLASLSRAYEMFKVGEEYSIDYVLYGPSLDTVSESQAKARAVMEVADYRKDCIAVISPHRDGVVNQTNSSRQTDNIIEFFSSLGSSSYAVFDSGYKYVYDRFSNQFRYIPCNPDVAGLMSRLDVNGFPWYSPAGQQRGILNGAIKLAYNPDKSQRDALYASRINAITNQPGIGIFLNGDRTALSYESAFDRINVRKLFLTVEEAILVAARNQLFELNDSTTRANFINIVEPYLRDVQANRGLYDFIVVCDTSNNTPAVIDNNEFRADIFLKPVRSINYITLTFVATRTGVSFSEVVGTV
jgi:hypothetical protein